MSIRLKSVLASMMEHMGIISWKLGRYPRDAAAVLMYHRVIPGSDVSAAVQAGMVVEPETLDLHLRYLRKHFTIVPLSALGPRSNDFPAGGPRMPLCALTFDDGWYDFYQHAYPVLKLHEAPATVFLPTDFVGTDRWFWTDRLGFLFYQFDKRYPNRGNVFRSPDPLLNSLLCLPGKAEQRLEQAIALLKPYRVEEIESVVARLAETLGDEAAPADRAFLSWEEVREMHGSGLIDFGSHTAGHLLLNTVTEAEARFELRKSMDALIARKVVDKHCVTFSYPNGNFSDRLSEMVKEEGYGLATTTLRGWHCRGANPFTIRRIAIHQDMASTAGMFGARIVNLI